MSKYKMFGIIGNVLLIIGTFLTFAKVSAFGITAKASLIQGVKGVIILLLGVLNLIILFFDVLKAKFAFMEKIEIIKNKTVLMIASIIAIVIIAITAIQLSTGEGSQYASLSLGFFVTLIGAILSIISARKYE